MPLQTRTPPEVISLCEQPPGADPALTMSHLLQPPADIWGVGCLVLELLLGHLPPLAALSARLPNQVRPLGVFDLWRVRVYMFVGLRVVCKGLLPHVLTSPAPDC